MELRRQQALLLRAEKAYQDARLAAHLNTRAPGLQEAAVWWAAEVDRLTEFLDEQLIFDGEDA